LKWREEGMRIKHSVNGNSVKLYDKAFTAVGSVLRAETSIHHGGEFRVYRRKEGDSKGKKSWRVLRGGVADLHRRAEISERATERYLDALAGVDEQTSLQELLDRLGRLTLHSSRTAAGGRMKFVARSKETSDYSTESTENAEFTEKKKWQKKEGILPGARIQ
jgi:hypothetical protein